MTDPKPKWRIVATNEEFVQQLCEWGYVKSDQVKEALIKVDRAYYAPYDPYHNTPVSLGFWSVTSTPELHVSALETLFHHLIPDASSSSNDKRRVLDVGSGSGYTTHLLAELIGQDGVIVGIESYKQLRDMGEKNFRKTKRGRKLLENGNVVFVQGDGRQGLVKELREGIRGVDEDSKWDVIHVAAAADGDVPKDLLDQLAAPGCMFIPITESNTFKDKVWKIEKDAQGNVERTIVHPRATYVKLEEPVPDSEQEMYKPGYGMLPKYQEPA